MNRKDFFKRTGLAFLFPSLLLAKDTKVESKIDYEEFAKVISVGFFATYHYFDQDGKWCEKKLYVYPRQLDMVAVDIHDHKIKNPLPSMPDTFPYYYLPTDKNNLPLKNNYPNQGEGVKEFYGGRPTGWRHFENASWEPIAESWSGHLSKLMGFFK